MQFQAIATGRGVSILAPTSIGSSRQVRMSDGAGAESWQTILSSDVSGLSGDIASAVAALVNSAPSTLDTLSELATALGNDPDFSTTIINYLSEKAPLASPEFIGNPILPAATTIGSVTAEEIARLSGVTSGIQSQINGKIDGAFAADQPFTETITWTAGAAPSNPSSLRFNWTRAGKLVRFSFRLVYGTAGTTVSQIRFPLPSSFPAPATFTGEGTSDKARALDGQAASNATISSAPANLISRMQRNAGNWEIQGIAGAGSFAYFQIGGSYQCV